MPADETLLAEYFTFTDFAKFVEVYLSVVDLVRDPDDIRTLTYEIGRELAGQNVRYVELTLTPASSDQPRHRGRGVLRGGRGRAGVGGPRLRRRDGLVLRHPGRGRHPGGRRDARRGTALPAGWARELRARRTRDRCSPPAVPALLRPGTSRRTAQRAARRRVDRAGDRLGRRPAPRRRCASATASRPPTTRSCSTIWRRPGIVLEVCPTSNVCTRSVPSLEEHPLPSLVAAGVTVTINSDDPPMFGTTLNQEYEVAASLLGLDARGRRGARRGRGRARRSWATTGRPTFAGRSRSTSRPPP